MKLMVKTLLVALACIAFSSTFVQAQPSMRDEIAANKKRSQAITSTAVGTNQIRISGGRVFNVLHSTNWITVPNVHERGKFLRNTPDGLAFEIEKKFYTGTFSTEFHYDRTIIVTNCPLNFQVTGEPMPPMRLLPLATSTFFAKPTPIYDWGTPPSTNSTVVKDTGR